MLLRRYRATSMYRAMPPYFLSLEQGTKWYVCFPPVPPWLCKLDNRRLI